MASRNPSISPSRCAMRSRSVPTSPRNSLMSCRTPRARRPRPQLQSFPRSCFPPIRSAHSLTPPEQVHTPSASANPFKVHRPLWNRAGRGRKSAVAAVVLPRAGMRGDVLHLPFLLPGAGLLRRPMPTESAAATEAGCQPETPGQPGGKARPPGPATGLPGTLPPAARDGSYFRRSCPVRQHQETITGNGNQHAIGGADR